MDEKIFQSTAQDERVACLNISNNYTSLMTVTEPTSIEKSLEIGLTEWLDQSYEIQCDVREERISRKRNHLDSTSEHHPVHCQICAASSRTRQGRYYEIGKDGKGEA